MDHCSSLEVRLCGMKLRNPVILAAGILGLRGSLLRRVAGYGAGAVTTKSIGIKENNGYRTPNLIEPYPRVVLNAMGLPNPGYDNFREEIMIAKQGGVPVIASVYGSNADEFEEVSKAMEEAGADMIELNLSCPHYGNRHLIGQDASRTAEVTKRVKNNIKIPVIVKLSPNVTDITEIAKAAIEAGADAISAINTIRALYIDIDRKAPVLSNKVGGMSGCYIKPIATRFVAEIALLIRKLKVNVSIIGIGGIYTGKDVIEMMMAGAQCVGVGTVVMHYGPEVIGKIVGELETLMKEKGINSIDNIVGCALDEIERCKLLG